MGGGRAAPGRLGIVLAYVPVSELFVTGIEVAAVSVSYGLVLLALAFRNFRAKDIVS